MNQSENQVFKKSQEANFPGNIKNTKPRICKKCGATLDEGNLFCIQCGWKIDFSTNETQEKTKDEPQTKIKINSDWLNAARRQQKTGIEEEVKKNREELQNLKGNEQTIKSNISKSSSGYFIHKDEEKTEYLIIKNISNGIISGEIRTVFHDSSFANEQFEGVLNENSISFHITQNDLHPSIGHVIVSDCFFSGTIDEDKIAGTMQRENGSCFMRYNKF